MYNCKMETTNRENSEGGNGHASKSTEDGDALSKLLAKDPVLGEVMKVLFKKMEETNKKLDDIRGELRRDIDLCQDQVNSLLGAAVKVPKVDDATVLESIPIVLQAESEDSGLKVAEDILGLPTILRRVLQEFSNFELIKQLSLVNKLWNFEARIVLRDRSCLKARISAPPCRHLVNFALDLEKMRVIPFTGIHVDLLHYNFDNCLSIETLDPFFQVILDQLQCKYFAIGFYEDWWKCPAALRLVERIFEESCGVLEDLFIRIDNEYEIQRMAVAEFVQRIVQGRSFPRLKTLKVNEIRCYLQTHAIVKTIKTMVSCAPNLEKCYVDERIDLNENIMEGSSAVLMVPACNPLYDQVCENLIDSLRIETMSVLRLFGLSFDVELLNRLVPMVIEASRTTLKTFTMDLLFAVPLMSYGICLENVTELCMYLNDTTLEATQRHTLVLVEGFEFIRVFPKLTKVTVLDPYERHQLGSDDISAFVERGDVVLRDALPDAAINIKHLKLESSLGNSTASFLAQMFPHVKTISFETDSEQEFPFTLLWEHFGCLAELHVDFNEGSSSITTNWDSVFCGILPEEVAELRAKDDEYLKTVNIAPVMPSITRLKDLRLFTLFCRGPFSSYNDRRDDPTQIISKVTGLIGFARCPALSVELYAGGTPGALDHMKPYVPFVKDSIYY